MVRPADELTGLPGWLIPVNPLPLLANAPEPTRDELAALAAEFAWHGPDLYLKGADVDD